MSPIKFNNPVIILIPSADLDERKGGRQNRARLQFFNLINFNETNLSVCADKVTIITIFVKF